jgi:hypothetical protein
MAENCSFRLTVGVRPMKKRAATVAVDWVGGYGTNGTN